MKKLLSVGLDPAAGGHSRRKRTAAGAAAGRRAQRVRLDHLPAQQLPDDPQRIREVVALANPGDTIRLAAGCLRLQRVRERLHLQGPDHRGRVGQEGAGAPATTIKHGMMPLNHRPQDTLRAGGAA